MRSTVSYVRVSSLVGALALAGACGGGSGGQDGTAALDSTVTPDGAGGGELRWYRTCGDPICRVGDAGMPSGVPACTTETVGASCPAGAAMCDPGEGCGVLLRCTDRDPRVQTGGCPISRRASKSDIRYLRPADLADLERQTRSIHLARYRYKDAPARERLGFIIDDAAGNPAIDEPRDMIDLYAYTSMVVATVQRQAARLDQQERQIAQLQAELRRRTTKP